MLALDLCSNNDGLNGLQVFFCDGLRQLLMADVKAEQTVNYSVDPGFSKLGSVFAKSIEDTH